MLKLLGETEYYYSYLNKNLINFTFTDEGLNQACKNQLIEDECEKQSEATTFACYHLEQINRKNVEDCTEPETYDYFSNSEISFILTFIGVGTVILGKK
jgi:dual oxidase